MYDFPELSAGVHVHVESDGTIHLPYAGVINAAGMSPRQLEDAITSALITRGMVKSPNVSVDIDTAVNLSVDVIGQVLSPKAVPLLAPASISYVLAQVGGLNGLAAHHLTILHPGGELPTSLDFDPDVPNAEVLHTVVSPGDIVHVASRGVYFIAGEVNRPGIYPIGGEISAGTVTPASGMGIVEHLTLLQALTQAGGISAIAARSKMRLIRTVDGKQEVIVVDQVKLYKGEIADPLIQPNDMIYVPSSYLRQQTNNLFATAISSLYAATQVKSVAQ